MKLIKMFFNGVHIFFVILAEILILALIAVVSINVFLRILYDVEFLRPFIPHAGFSWANEVPSSVLIPLFAFLGMIMGIKENVHIDINILPRKLPKWFEIFMSILKFTSYIIFGIIFLYYGIILVKSTSTSILPATGLPASLQYVILPIVSIPFIYEGIMGILGFFGIKKDDEHLEKILTLDKGENK